MDIRIIEDALRDYKRKKSIVETTLARIHNYENAISNPDAFTAIFLGSSIEPGMPRGSSTSSSVEIAVTEKEKSIEILRQWIKDDKSRIYPYQVELEQIDCTLNALNRQERFIIECKYFENMFWRDIEIAFNDKFRQQNYITVSGIRKMNTEVLYTISQTLKPYFTRHKKA